MLIVCLFVVVLHPSNIYGHIRTGTDLWQCTLVVLYSAASSGHWHYDLLSHSVTLSWHWAIQSLLYPNNAERQVRKRQVSVLKSLVWLDQAMDSNSWSPDSLISQVLRCRLLPRSSEIAVHYVTYVGTYVILRVYTWMREHTVQGSHVQGTDRMADLVERLFPVLGDWGDSDLMLQTLVNSKQWLKNWYLSLPSQVLGIIRIGERLVGSVLGQCDWVGYQVMELTTWFPSGTAL